MLGNSQESEAAKPTPTMAQNAKENMPNGTHDRDDVDADYYIEMLDFRRDLQRSLEQLGYSNLQVTPEPEEPDCYSLNMRSENNALEAVIVRQQLSQIVSAIPATHQFHITWRVLQSVAVVQGAQVAAAIRVKAVLGKPPSTR